METEKIFRYFCAAEYDQCLRYGEKTVRLNIPRETKDFILLICAISSMFEGSTNIDNKEIWLKVELKNRMISNDTNDFLILLKGFEGAALLFNGAAEKSKIIITNSINKSKTEKIKAESMHFLGVYLFNSSEDVEKALDVFKKVDSILNENIRDAFDNFMYYWNKSFISFCLIRLNKYKEAILNSSIILDFLNVDNYYPLYEYAYLTIAEAYAGLLDEVKTFENIDKNINLWEKKQCAKRVAVGAMVGFEMAGKLNNTNYMKKYADIRFNNWIPWNDHWDKIMKSFKDLGMNNEARRWVFNESISKVKTT